MSSRDRASWCGVAVIPRVATVPKRIGAVLDWIPGGLAIVRNGRFAYVNAAFARRAALEASALVGHPVAAALGDDDVATLMRATRSGPGRDIHIPLRWGPDEARRRRRLPTICRRMLGADGTDVVAVSIGDCRPYPDTFALVRDMHSEQLDASIRQISHFYANSIQGALMLLGWARASGADGDPEAVADLASHLSTMSRMFELDAHWPDDTIPLPDLIAHVLRTVARPLGLACALELQPAAASAHRVERAHRFPVSMVLSELVTNAAKHGRSRDAKITVGAVGDGVRLQVRNEGRLDPAGAERQRGLVLAQGMLPREGATLALAQDGDAVVATLMLHPPVVTRR